LPATSDVVHRSDDWKKESGRCETVRSITNQLLTFIMSQSATAPEKIRTKVNVAASMSVCFSAARQSSELLANAIIANSVRIKILAVVTGENYQLRIC
jgi:hypothetical protein